MRGRATLRKKERIPWDALSKDWGRGVFGEGNCTQLILLNGSVLKGKKDLEGGNSPARQRREDRGIAWRCAEKKKRILVCRS